MNEMNLSDLLFELVSAYNAQNGLNLGFFDRPIYLDIDDIKTPLKAVEIDLKGGAIVLHGEEV